MAFLFKKKDVQNMCLKANERKELDTVCYADINDPHQGYTCFFFDSGSGLFSCGLSVSTLVLS